MFPFSQDPSDSNTILGGAQDNGSPATGSSQSSTQWLSINSGDGGYNAINPSNANQWFTANFDVSIQRCDLGVSCHSGDFNLLVSNSTLAGDRGPFYTPYILDPQSSSAMLVGTCRVWRGSTAGAAFNPLTNNFETNTASVCTGSESNLVRSLTAGGPKDSNGLSNVIYAGTDGVGTPAPGIPAGGHLWATTNAAGGSAAWQDRTQNINPQNFPISAIAIDTSDATGQTAYVTVMGFHVPHVWKTADAGQTWTDFSGNLPDAPANAIAVDAGTNPTNGTVYVGTDVGVFSASTGTGSPVTWTEVGPDPGSGQAGYLPNVPVTAVALFKSEATKKLRASTYGRGLWEFNLVVGPDYRVAVTAPTQTAFPSQTATFNGTLTPVGGYNSQVNLSCTAGATSPPSTCNPTPTAVAPANSTVFNLKTGGPVGDYSFNLHMAGSDPNTTAHNFPLTLHVVNFGLTAPSSSTVVVNRPGTSAAITLQVTAAGSFSGAVPLTCSGLPPGANCDFSPSSTVSPVSNTPVTVSLTVGTSAVTSPGTFPLTISANTTGAPAAKTQSLTLTITAGADYLLTVKNSLVSATAGSQASVTGSVAAVNGYSSTVTLSCGTGAPPTCQVSGVSLTPSTAGTPFSVTLSSTQVKNYSFNVVAQGSDPLAISHSAPITFESAFDFSMVPNTTSQTVKSGQTANYNLDFVPAGGTFPTAVTLSCSGAPARSICSFNPSQIASGTGETVIVASVATSAPIAYAPPRGSLLYALAFPLPALFFVFAERRKQRIGRKTATSILSLSAVFLLIGLLVACGGGSAGSGGNLGGGQPGTPAGTYSISVTATSGTLPHSTSVDLTVQ